MGTAPPADVRALMRAEVDVRGSAKRVLARAESLLEHNAIWASALAIVAALQLVLIVTHGAWLDEYQALLIATEPGSVREMLGQLRYEGHPPLWYLLLRLLNAGLPTSWVLPAASIMCAAAIQASLLIFSPFPRAERLMLALSEAFIFEYGTISRGLALGVAIFMLALVLWRTRAVWFLVPLLPLCEFLFGVLSIALLVLLWRERRLSIAGLITWTLCACSAALAVIPAPDTRGAIGLYSLPIEASDFMERFGTIVFPLQTFNAGFAWDGMAPLITGVFLGPLLLLWMVRRTSHCDVQRRIMLLCFSVWFAMSVFVYALHFRYISLLSLLLVAFAWLNPPPGPDIWWRRWLAVTAACGIFTSAWAVAHPFDAAPEAAALVRSMDDGKHPWLAFPASRIPALSALTGKRFVQPEQGCSQSYALWNHRSTVYTWRQYGAALSDWADRYGESFIVLEYMPRKVPENVFKPLTRRLHGYDGQSYIVGVLAPGRPTRVVEFRPCRAQARDVFAK